jgi:nitrogen fixation NifU-like protein
MYNDTVIKHFENPQYTGEIEDADAVVSVGNPECGDMMKLYIKVADNRITDIRYKTFGCAAAIATSSIGAELAAGKGLDEAAAITSDDIVDALGGLPEKKVLCSTLFPEAIRKAVAKYRQVES